MPIYISTLAKKNICSYPVSALKGKMHQVMMAVYHADENGLTTREVADICDLSVYSARNWLMKLENEAYIMKKEKPRNTTWHRI